MNSSQRLIACTFSFVSLLFALACREYDTSETSTLSASAETYSSSRAFEESSLEAAIASASYTVNLQSHLKKQYLTAENQGGGAVNANRPKAASWETFRLIDINGGELRFGDLVYLETLTGYLLQVTQGTSEAINAASRNRGEWETFRLVGREGTQGKISSGDLVGFQSVSNQKFLAAWEGGGSHATIHGQALGTWELFHITLLAQTNTPSQPPSPALDRASCKRGGAYGYHSVADMQTFSKGASWWYNWSLSPEASVAQAYQNLGMEFVPMVWGNDFSVADAVAKIPQGSKYLLAFNEPNFKVQSNMSPAQAAARWPEIEEIARRRNLQIVSPAVNYCGPAKDCHETDPFVYLDKFFAACKSCKVDYIAVHWYACRPEYLENYLKGFAKYGRKLWLTEFACGDGNAEEKSLAGQSRWMSEALDNLEKNPNVFRYAWFQARTSDPYVPNASLLGASGVLTSLGQRYLSAPSSSAGACTK